MFRLDREEPPFPSCEMLDFIETVGAPHILVVLGLGVDERILRACERSVKIYNSIDAPALRVPFEVSRHFDLVLTGGRMAVRRGAGAPSLHALCGDADRAGIRRPPKPSARSGWKRSTTSSTSPPPNPTSATTSCSTRWPPRRALSRRCASSATARWAARCATRRGSAVSTSDFVGPPGVGFAEVNALMNQARVGVVCGVDDGAPAILTEYMLAGLPVLANERLACGLQFITPESGRTASAEGFADALVSMLDEPGAFRPRQTVLDRWIWPRTVERLAGLVEEIRASADPRCGAERYSARRVEN